MYYELYYTGQMEQIGQTADILRI